MRMEFKSFYVYSGRTFSVQRVSYCFPNTCPFSILIEFGSFTTRLHLLQRTTAKWLPIQCPASAAGNAAILDEYVRTVDGTPLAFLRIEGPDSFQVVFCLVHTYPPFTTLLFVA